MIAAEVRDGVVENVIVIATGKLAAYALQADAVLVPLPEGLAVAAGDLYDADTSTFYRDEAPISPAQLADVGALRAQVQALSEALSALLGENAAEEGGA
ncbi:MAG: hypothetical protein LBU67_02125 [Oscillospiraceae bacterium]|jgi:hypothetical protein|nr:hypothetical protein [Oscillospiraceae bacterium]